MTIQTQSAPSIVKLMIFSLISAFLAAACEWGLFHVMTWPKSIMGFHIITSGGMAAAVTATCYIYFRGGLVAIISGFAFGAVAGLLIL